jgi:hypothetical protein
LHAGGKLHSAQTGELARRAVQTKGRLLPGGTPGGEIAAANAGQLSCSSHRRASTTAKNLCMSNPPGEDTWAFCIWLPRGLSFDHY